MKLAYEQGRPGRVYWWVAPTLKQSRIAWRRAKNNTRGQGIKFSQSPGMEARLPNGALVMWQTGDDPDNLYGEDVYGVVLDEASRIKADSIDAVQSTLTATRGPLRAIGNVRSKGDRFYQLCRKAEQGLLDDSHYAMITADDAIAAGVTVAAEVEAKRKSMLPHLFDALYRCIPYEAQHNVFGGSANINACLAPLSQKDPVAWGWDFARSGQRGGDWTVGIGLDEDAAVCRIHQWHGQKYHHQEIGRAHV